MPSVLIIVHPYIVFMFRIHSVVCFSSPLLLFSPLFSCRKNTFSKGEGQAYNTNVEPKKKKRQTKITLLSCVIASRLSEAVLRVWSDNYFQICVTLKMESERHKAMDWTWTRFKSLYDTGKRKKQNPDRAVQIRAKSALCKLGVCGSNFFSLFVWTWRQNTHDVP